MRWERLGDEIVILDTETGVVHRIPAEAAETVEVALSTGETSRRRMLALLAAGSIAGVTSLALPSVAAAASGEVDGSGTTGPAPVAPGAPTGLAASNETNTTITLSWTAVEGATSYVVRFRTGATGEFAVLQSNITGVTYTATGLTINTVYNFTVRAIKSGLESVDSSVVSVSTTNNSSLSAPGAPTVTLDANDPAKLTVSWTAVSGATSYELWRAIGDGTSATKLMDSATSPVAESGLSANTRYRYAVKAKNADFISDLSDEGSLLTPPSSPATPTFGTVTDTSVRVEWSVVAGATSYEVFARTGSGAFVSKGTTEFPFLVVGSLSASTSYDFRVTAINTGGSSLPSASASRSTAPAAPAPSLGSVGASSVTVSWAAVTGATSYEVFYGTSSGSITTSAGTTSGTSLTVSGLTAGTAYWFAVTSSNGTDTSAASSSASTSTIPAAPGTPTFGTVTATSVQVQWSAVTGAAASGTGGYEVFYGTSSGSITTSGGSTYGTSLTVSGLTAGTTYWFTVKAGNASGWSAASTSASKITLPSATAAPTLGSIATTSMSVSWSTVTGATGYEVLYRVSGAGSFSSAGTGLTSPVTISGLTAGTTYEVAVVASNGSGSNQSSSTTAPTLPTAPSAPTFGTVTATSIQVQWSAVTGAASSGTGGYRVKYGTSSTSISSDGGTTFGTSLTISSLTAGTTYWFTVEAGNASGWSAVSTSASKITLPAQVATVTPTASGDSAALSWSAVTSATSYLVEYKTKASGTWLSSGTVSTNSATVTGLIELTAYDFRVSATNASGTGAVSSTVSATTLQYGTGGTETTYTSDGVTYRVHTFNSSGTFTWNASRTVDYLIVGGGGGGGGGGFNDGRSITAVAPSYSYVGGFGGGGGGGGAGDVKTGSASRSAGTYAVVVGAKGVAGQPKTGSWDVGCAGGAGGDSSLFGLTARRGIGGHGGGNFNNNADAYDNGTTFKTGATNLVVGSGGGGGESGSGLAGGAASLWTSWAKVGAQGGSSANAGASPATTRYGVVAGTSSTISGSSVRYGDGGGGGGEWGTSTSGSRSTTAGSGGGGGEGRFAGTDGQDGIVIVRYAI